MASKSTVGRAIEELYAFFFTKIEDTAIGYAFLIPILFHKLIVDLWNGFKLFIQDCLEILDIIFVTVSRETQLHHPDIHRFFAPKILAFTDKSRNNAYALEAKRLKWINVLKVVFNAWKETAFTVEKDIIHPSVNLATKTTKHYYAKVVAISEPAIAITQPVWSPIVEKVVDTVNEVNEAVIYSPVFGPVVEKVEHMMADAVESVVAYCNNDEVVCSQ